MKLRSYQERAIGELRGAYARGRRSPCLVLPTGAGKTVVAAEIIRAAVERGKRVLFNAHREELIRQSVNKLEAAGITDVRVIQAGETGNPTAAVAVASVPTLTRYVGSAHAHRLPAADLVIFDEAHHVIARTWAGIATHYAHAHLLGLTATPQRGDGKPLGDVFDELVVGATVRELTELGHLVPCRVIAPLEKLDTGEIAQSPAAAYAQHAMGRRAVIFCRTLDHAREVAAAMPVPTEIVHGGLASKARAESLARFQRGEILAVANVHVLTEGWDDPGAEVCILARQPQHAGTYLQMVGRVLRPAPGKRECLLLDLGGAMHDHGTPDAERTFSLEGKAISLAADREIPRQCPTCGAVFRLAEIIDGRCPVCGEALPRKLVEAPRVTGAQLAEVTGSRPPRPMKPVFLPSKYASRCTCCHAPIYVGDQIAWVKGEKPKHALCWADEVLAS